MEANGHPLQNVYTAMYTGQVAGVWVMYWQGITELSVLPTSRKSQIRNTKSVHLDSCIKLSSLRLFNSLCVDNSKVRGEYLDPRRKQQQNGEKYVMIYFFTYYYRD